MAFAASNARRIQEDIPDAGAYRVPPQASASLEPRGAWDGEEESRNVRHEGAHYAVEPSGSTYGISNRVLDPYFYEWRAAETASQFNRRDRSTVTVATKGNAAKSSIHRGRKTRRASKCERELKKGSEITYILQGRVFGLQVGRKMWDSPLGGTT